MRLWITGAPGTRASSWVAIHAVRGGRVHQLPALIDHENSDQRRRRTPDRRRPRQRVQRPAGRPDSRVDGVGLMVAGNEPSSSEITSLRRRPRRLPGQLAPSARPCRCLRDDDPQRPAQRRLRANNCRRGRSGISRAHWSPHRTRVLRHALDEHRRMSANHCPDPPGLPRRHILMPFVGRQVCGSQ